MKRDILIKKPILLLFLGVSVIMLRLVNLKRESIIGTEVIRYEYAAISTDTIQTLNYFELADTSSYAYKGEKLHMEQFITLN